MDKKHITGILVAVGIFLIVFSFILLCVSAAFVRDIEDMLGFGMNITADMVRTAAKTVAELPTDIMNDISAGYLLEELGLGGGFRMFALNARGWCFGFGIISLAAAAVMLAVEENSRLGHMALEVIKEFCAAVASGFRSMIDGISIRLPRWKHKTTRPCPKCGASCAENAHFCSRCGEPLE